VNKMLFDEAYERFVQNWWFDYSARHCYVGDLDRHPDLKALNATTGAVYDPLVPYWPEGESEDLGRYLLSAEGIGPETWLGRTATHLVLESIAFPWLSDDLRADAREMGRFWSPRFKGRTSYGNLPQPSLPLSKLKVNEYGYDWLRTIQDWSEQRSNPLPPPHLITPARTFTLRLEATGGESWCYVLFATRPFHVHDWQGVYGKSPSPQVACAVCPLSHADFYRNRPVREWRELARRHWGANVPRASAVTA
jgi:hypothetical protein